MFHMVLNMPMILGLEIAILVCFDDENKLNL